MRGLGFGKGGELGGEKKLIGILKGGGKHFCPFYLGSKAYLRIIIFWKK